MATTRNSSTAMPTTVMPVAESPMKRDAMKPTKNTAAIANRIAAVRTFARALSPSASSAVVRHRVERLAALT